MKPILYLTASLLLALAPRQCALVDKANVLPSLVFFRSMFGAVAREFPDVQASHIYVNAMAHYLVQRPETFDVLVTESIHAPR